jgi:hypothetical protein
MIPEKCKITRIGTVTGDGQPMDFFFDGEGHPDTCGFYLDMKTGIAYWGGWTAQELRLIAAARTDVDRDAERYRWLRDKGADRQVVSSPSMGVGQGPFIRFEPPALNRFSGITLTGDLADQMIDEAMAGSQPPETPV